MANIQHWLDQIRRAIYGREVRSSIADSIEAINKEQSHLDGAFNQLIINAGNSNAEIVAARVKADGTQFNTLGERLAKSDEQFVELNKEVIEARTDKNGADHRRLKIRLDDIDEQLDTISINFDKIPKLESETNELQRLKRVYSTVPEGSTILFGNKTYDFGDGTIELTRNVNLKGSKLAYYDVYKKKFIEGTGTIFKNLKIIMKSRGYIIENIANQSENIDNGFEANTGNCADVKIINCACKCYSHAYLFEGYEGYVNNIKVYDSYAYDSTHGFITKSLNTQFINCHALNMSEYGFGFISDNIPGATKKGNATGGITINCKAENCKRGIAMYSRDMHSDNNVNSISLSKIKHIGFNAINCETGYMFGDGLITTTGVTYNPIYDIECIGCSSIHSDSTQTSLEIKKVVRLKFMGYVDGQINHNGFVVKDVELSIISPLGNRRRLVDNITINSNATYPSLDLKNAYENTVIFENTEPTIVQGLLGGNFNKGDILTLRINDDFTYIKNNSNLKLQKPLYKNKGTWIKLLYDGTNWNEIESCQNGVIMNQIKLVDSGVIDSTLVNNIDCVITTSTTNKITLPPPTIYTNYTLFVRNVSGGVASYGGFDNSNLVISDLIKTTLSNGQAQSIEFEYNPFTNKWICIKVIDSKVF